MTTSTLSLLSSSKSQSNCKRQKTEFRKLKRNVKYELHALHGILDMRQAELKKRGIVRDLTCKEVLHFILSFPLYFVLLWEFAWRENYFYLSGSQDARSANQSFTKMKP